MGKIKKLCRNNWLLILIIAVISIFLIWMGTLKGGMHVDEVSSYLLSNSYYNIKLNRVDEWLPTSYLYDMVATQSNTAFEYGSVFYNQSQDVHPPLYYSIIHTLSSLFIGTYNKWIGLSVNLLSFIISAIVVYKIISIFTNNKIIGYITVIMFGFSISTIDNFVFIRMYFLLTAIQLLLLYVSLKYVEDNNHVKYLIITALTTIAGGLTQYYFYLYAVFVTICVAVILISLKKIKYAIYYSLTSLLSVFTAFYIFPSVFDHVKGSDRGEQVVGGLLGGLSEEKFKDYLDIINANTFAGYGKVIVFVLLFLLIIISILYIFNRKQVDFFKLEQFILILIPTCLSFFLISQVSPFQTSRYIFAITPMFILVVLILSQFVFTSLLKNEVLVSSVLMFLVGTIVMLGFTETDKIEYLYPEMSSNHQKIENLNLNKAVVITDKTFKTKSQINELIEFNQFKQIDFSGVSGLYNDDKLSKENEFVLFVEKNNDSESVENDILENTKFNNCKKLYTHSYFNIYFVS